MQGDMVSKGVTKYSQLALLEGSLDMVWTYCLVVLANLFWCRVSQVWSNSRRCSCSVIPTERYARPSHAKFNSKRWHYNTDMINERWNAQASRYRNGDEHSNNSISSSEEQKYEISNFAWGRTDIVKLLRLRKTRRKLNMTYLARLTIEGPKFHTRVVLEALDGHDRSWHEGRKNVER